MPKLKRIDITHGYFSAEDRCVGHVDLVLPKVCLQELWPVENQVRRWVYLFLMQEERQKWKLVWRKDELGFSLL